jgi:hypothetical protein
MIVAGRHDKGLTELIFYRPGAAEQYSYKSWKHFAIKLSTSEHRRERRAVEQPMVAASGPAIW